ncbi:hypothetical protein ACTFIT_006621 [Dictyostelium discoideum]
MVVTIGFPKGKVNKDEPDSVCAIREVFKETYFYPRTRKEIGKIEWVTNNLQVNNQYSPYPISPPTSPLEDNNNNNNSIKKAALQAQQLQQQSQQNNLLSTFNGQYNKQKSQPSISNHS